MEEKSLENDGLKVTVESLRHINKVFPSGTTSLAVFDILVSHPWGTELQKGWFLKRLKSGSLHVSSPIAEFFAGGMKRGKHVLTVTGPLLTAIEMAILSAFRDGRDDKPTAKSETKRPPRPKRGRQWKK